MDEQAIQDLTAAVTENTRRMQDMLDLLQSLDQSVDEEVSRLEEAMLGLSEAVQRLNGNISLLGGDL